MPEPSLLKNNPLDYFFRRCLTNAEGFQYDASDQPISMTDGAGSSSYTYDGHKRRVKQVVDGKVSYSVYSKGGVLLLREAVNDTKKTEYLPLSGTTGNIRLENGVASYQHLDHLGSPVAETKADGSLAWRERYTPALPGLFHFI